MVDTPRHRLNTHGEPAMTQQNKNLERSPLLQQIQENLRAQVRHPIVASSPVVKEIIARQASK